jgi:hypothetical protein
MLLTNEETFTLFFFLVRFAVVHFIAWTHRYKSASLTPFDWITTYLWHWSARGVPLPALGCGGPQGTAAVRTSEVWCDGIRLCNITASKLLIAGHSKVTKCHHISRPWLSAQTLSSCLSHSSTCMIVSAALSCATWSDGSTWAYSSNARKMKFTVLYANSWLPWW